MRKKNSPNLQKRRKEGRVYFGTTSSSNCFIFLAEKENMSFLSDICVTEAVETHMLWNVCASASFAWVHKFIWHIIACQRFSVSIYDNPIQVF